MTDPRETQSATPEPSTQPLTDQTMKSEGPLDKIKKAVGHAIGSEGKRHGARDTDPGS